MKKHTLIVTLFIISVCSCSDDENIKTVNIPDPIQLSCIEHKSDVDLLMSAGIFTQKDKLIVFEPTMTDMFKIFDLQSLKYLYSFGDVGRSNNEFSSLLDFQSIISSEYLEVLDVNKIKFVEFTDSAASIVKSRSLPLAQLKNPINRLKKISDTTYYFDNFFEKDFQKEFLKYNFKTKDLTQFSKYPKWDNSDIPEPEKFMIYSKASTYNISQKKIASFYFNFPVMKIINETTGEVITETHLNLPDFSFSNINTKNIIFGGAHSSDNYIYAMWVNSSKEDIGASKGDFKPVIMVFDWSGNLITSYQLAHMAITFTVLDDQSIYTPSFDFDEATNMVYEYKLPYIKPKACFGKFENEQYSIDLFPNYIISHGSKELDGINKVVEYDGYKVNINYFTQKDDVNGKKKYDLGAIQISVFEKIDTDTKAPLFNNENGIIRTKNISIEQKKVTQNTLKNEFTDHKKNKTILYTNSFSFDLNNKYVNISISSDSDNFTQSNAYIRHMIKSMTIK